MYLHRSKSMKSDVLGFENSLPRKIRSVTMNYSEDIQQYIICQCVCLKVNLIHHKPLQNVYWIHISR